jgi:hypothetical protein
MERVSQALIPRCLETVNDSTLYSAIIILMIDQSHSPHNQAPTSNAASYLLKHHNCLWCSSLSSAESCIGHGTFGPLLSQPIVLVSRGHRPTTHGGQK